MGFGVVAPQRSIDRFIAVVVMLFGIGFLAVISGEAEEGRSVIVSGSAA